MRQREESYPCTTFYVKGDTAAVRVRAQKRVSVVGILKKATVNDEGEIGNEVLCLTLAHYLADWLHWLMSASSPPVPEGRALLLQSVQLLSVSGAAAAAAAPLHHPPPLHYRASPSLGPHFRCRSLHLGCRPPILKIKELV